MAKNTREGTLKTKQLIQANMVAMVLTEGWGSVTYAALAKEIGVSRACIQNHFPSTASMVLGIDKLVLSTIKTYIQETPGSNERALFKGIQENVGVKNAVSMLLTVGLSHQNTTLCEFLGTIVLDVNPLLGGIYKMLSFDQD